MGIAILKAGKVVVVLQGAKAAELSDHIRNGYPHLLPDLPSLTAVEYPDAALPPVDPPPPPTPEEVAAEEAKSQLDLVTKKMFMVALNHENRIRAIEGKAAVTAAQFKAALASL